MFEDIILVITVLIIHVAGPLSALHAVLNSPSSQGAIAWAISLTTFPYISLPAYWMVGRNRFDEYLNMLMNASQEIWDLAIDVLEEISVFAVEVSKGDKVLFAAEKLARIPILSDNNVELLVDGEETFHSIFEGIESAKNYLLVQFFIVMDDELGREFKKRLIGRAKAGVKVYFMYDSAGCTKLPKRYLRELREAGIPCFDFHAQKGPLNRFRINFRNHRKAVVVDGHTAWIGGLNVGDEYLGKGQLGTWRDTHMKITGPSAINVQIAFAEDWYWASGGEVPEVTWKPKPANGDTKVLIVPTGPSDTITTAELMFVHAINSAKKRVWIASPYFVPGESVISALQLAGLRGVDVRILIPDNPDHYVVYLAGFSYLKDAGKTGVKFYRYREGFMHQKVLLVDDEISAIGTANMDNRSLRLNFEITGFVISEEFNAQVSDMLERDFARSRYMEPNEYEKFSFFFNLKIRLARLWAPLL